MPLFQSKIFNLLQENRMLRKLLIICVIVIPNFLLVLPLFSGGYTQFLSSIDGVFIADANFIAKHWPYSSWNPLWYSGFPFDFFYTPLLPYLLAFFHNTSSNLILIPDLYRITAGLSYVLAPLTLYFFTKQLVKRELTALASALAYSFLPFAYLFQEVYNDALFSLSQWQLHVITRYADVPHMTSLSLIPIAALLFLKTLQAPSYWRYVLTSIFIAIIALFNWVGFFSLILILAVILSSELFISDIRQKVSRFFCIIALTFGFLAFWYTPEFIRKSVNYGSGDISSLIVIFIPLSGILGTIILVNLFNRQPKRQTLFIIGGWFGIFFTDLFFHYLLNIELFPQSNRYLPEFSMGASMLVAMAATTIFDRLESLIKSKNIHSRIIISSGYKIGLILLFFCLFIYLIGPSWNVAKPHPDIENSSEYQIAIWLNNHVQDGERVYATGSNSFWLNAFTDIPQVCGGSNQASTNIWWEAVAYNFQAYYDGDLSTLWARAFNVKYIVVNFPNSTVPYKNYDYPNKFESLLEKIYEMNGDAIYEVPLVNPEIAQIVNIDEVKNLEPVVSVIDYNNLENYVAVNDQKNNLSSLKIINFYPNQLTLNTSIKEGEAIQIQITYDSGWKAYSREGEDIPLEPDPLGFILLYPKLGEQIIHIQHTTKTSVWLGRMVSVLTVLVVIIYPIWRRFRRKQRAPRELAHTKVKSSTKDKQAEKQELKKENHKKN